jgi:hypothetical protein
MQRRPSLSGQAGLAAAIEELYRVFAAPTPAVIDGCPCCIDTRKVDVLLATPLRELRADHLWRYITGAYLTVGGDRDFRYLLPRIFELAALEAGMVPDPEIVLGKLARAGWEKWRESERAAVLAFIDAWFAEALQQDLRGADYADQTETLLCAIACAGQPLSEWLSRLTQPVNAPVLAALRARHPHELSPFWEDAPDGWAEVSAFLGTNEA